MIAAIGVGIFAGIASLVEYALLLSLIMLVALALASASAFGSTVSGSVDDSASRVVSAGGLGP
ncbi:MAG: hypothetical protein P8J50_05145 [Acidimicrobiales bacterium]|nr:hypothetical protein [Acidimicrobiales bacterium]